MRSAHTALPVSRSFPTFVAAFLRWLLNSFTQIPAHTQEPTYTQHTHTHTLHFQLVEACIHAFTRFYRHTQTETHAIMATATVFYLFTTTTAAATTKLLLKREKTWIKIEWTRLFSRLWFVCIKAYMGAINLHTLQSLDYEFNVIILYTHPLTQETRPAWARASKTVSSKWHHTRSIEVIEIKSSSN